MNPSSKKRRSEKDKLIIHLNWARTISFQDLQLAADQVCYSRFYLLWLREDISALVTGMIPTSVTEVNVPTNPVHILDIGVFLPALLLTALLLWRRKLMGSLLAGSFLVFCTLMETVILSIFLIMSSKGMPTSIGIEVFFAIIIVVSLILSVFYIREVK